MEFRIPIDPRQIEAFCQRWGVSEFSVFGSILRDDFRPDSDVDVLLEYGPTHDWDWNVPVQMKDELERIFGRKVDMVSKGALKNPFRRHSIMTSRRVLYAA